MAELEDGRGGGEEKGIWLEGGGGDGKKAE